MAPSGEHHAHGHRRLSRRRIAGRAAFERTLVTPDTPYDHFVHSDANAMSQAQLRGMALFESLGCVTCQACPAFSDASLPAAGMPLRIIPANPTPYEDKYRLLDDRGGWKMTGRCTAPNGARSTSARRTISSPSCAP